MSLSTPQTVRKLQAALHAKAKGSPRFRFYSLYDKVYRPDILYHAYATSKANGGSSGVDGQTFEDIEAYGLERWLGELAYRAVDAHVTSRLRQWLCAKHKVSSGGYSRYSDRYLTQRLGLVRLPLLRRNYPRANA